MVRATKLKVIVFYLDHRFDSAFRENQNICELQGETTSDTEITESIYGHTINPALGHLLSNKDHCNLTIKNHLHDKNSIYHLNFLKTFGQVDFILAGFRLEKIFTGFYCLTWWQTSVIPKSSWIPA